MSNHRIAFFYLSKIIKVDTPYNNLIAGDYMCS